MMDAEIKPKISFSSEFAICPWCAHEHGDCWEWVTDVDVETECDGCGRIFAVSANYSVIYRSCARWIGHELDAWEKRATAVRNNPSPDTS